MGQKQDLLQGAKRLTVFNIKWGYYNLLLRKEDQKYTAFLTDLGLYEWVVAPIGLTRLPAEFARFMTYILRKYLNKTIAVYFNDVIVFSRNPEEHEKHVREVMQIMMDAGLMMSI
jgi:hypothetical protein